MKLIREFARINDINVDFFWCPHCFSIKLKQRANGKRDKSCGCQRYKFISDTLKGRQVTPMTEEIKRKISRKLTGFVRSKEHCRNIAKAKMGSKNPSWKGDNVGLSSLHQWIKSRKEKPDFCECCNNAEPYDLANISQEYKRDINDYEWLCRRCHMEKDGRIELLKTIGCGRNN